MLMKAIIIMMMLGIVISLGSALFYLLNNQQTGSKMAKALTYRIGLSLTLFVLLLIAFGLGWVTPHGVQ